jgi:hypothetical protein
MLQHLTQKDHITAFLLEAALVEVRYDPTNAAMLVFLP